MKQNRVCIDSGYKYVYGGVAKRWKTSRNESWDTEVTKAVCGTFMGRRNIDGALRTVVRAGGKFYAATHATPGLPASRAKKGTRFV